MKKIILYVFLVLIGGILGFVVANLPFSKTEYFVLSSDYKSNIGEIKKGTKLKFDQTYPEGFSRYILYINIDDSEAPKELYAPNGYNEKIPYWFEINK